MKKVYLSLETPLKDKKVYPLISTVTIGRSEENIVRLSDPIVSRNHARITPQKEQWLLQDRGSANGVIHRGKRVLQQVLKVGDSFQIGTTTFSLVELDDASGDLVDYQVQMAESDRLVESLELCFDGDGILDRQLFLQQTHILTPYHERVFPMLLNHLKRSTSKENRILLLNAIPDLYEGLDEITTPMHLLLREFCSPAEAINAYDRNLLMLAVQLLRRYRKEKSVEIEATPEEVLLVQKGLRQDSTRLARQTVVELDQQILTKLGTIHTALIKSLSGSKRETPGEFRPRYLFSLSREFYILMGLIGGAEATSAVWEGVSAISNPQSHLYHQTLSKIFLNNIIGLLRIALRSYLRLVGEDPGHRENLISLKNRMQGLVPLIGDEKQQTNLRRFVRLLDAKLQT